MKVLEKKPTIFPEHPVQQRPGDENENHVEDKTVLRTKGVEYRSTVLFET